MCDNGIRADRVNFKLLERMKRAGFKMLGFGIESGSQKVLDNIKKNSKVEDMKKAVSYACRLGYRVELFFLIGSPGETWDDFMQSVRFATEFPVAAASFYQLLPYPGTELFDYTLKKGYLLEKPEIYLNKGSQRRNTPFFQTPELGYRDRKRAYRTALKALKKSPVLKCANRKFYEENIKKKLAETGIEGKLQKVICGIYCNSFLHEYVFNSRPAAAIKNRLLKKQRAGIE